MDRIRSNLQSITFNLPDPVRSTAVSIIGPACYKQLVIDIDLLPSPCLSFAISKSLGVGIIAASSIVKVPQLLKLISSQSAAGVSFLSYVLETSSYLITLIYSARNAFPFSTYGETALIAAQNVVISVLVLRFGGKNAAAAVFIAVLAAAVVTLQNESLVDMKTLSYFQAGAGLLGVASKVPQIWTIYRQGGTGQLSAFAIFNFLAGSLARIFTALKEVDDKLILSGFIAGFLLNAVLAAQMVYYWKSPASASHAKELGKKPEQIAMGSSTGTAARSKGPTTRRRG